MYSTPSFRPICIAQNQAAPPRLVVLDIGHNFIDDSAIEVIATGLEENRVLTNLILQGNGIGEKVSTVVLEGT